MGLSEGIVIEKFPSKSVKAPRFEFWTVMLTPTSGRLFSSLTVPEIVFVCEKTNIGNKINLIEYEEKIFNTKPHKIIEASDSDFFDNTIRFTIPEDKFFFMGDNRDNSKDSRASEVGFVPKINLIGKAQIIFFSHNGSAKFYEFWKWHDLIRFSRIGKKIE